MEEKLFKTIYCANEQEETEQELFMDDNGETVAVCSVCGRALKFPASVNKKKEFNDLLAKHKDANKGQVGKVKQKQAIKELADRVEEVALEAPVVEEPIK
jgi:hypothetical protein